MGLQTRASVQPGMLVLLRQISLLCHHALFLLHQMYYLFERKNNTKKERKNVRVLKSAPGLFLVELSASVLGKAADNFPHSWIPTTHMGNLDGSSLILAPCWPKPACWVVSQQMEDFSFSLSISPFLCYSDFLNK